MQTQEVCVSPQGIVWCILHMQVLHVCTLTKDCSLRAPSSEASSMNMAISLWILPITNASAVVTNKGNCGKEIRTSHTIAHKCTHTCTFKHIETHTDTCTYTSLYTIYMTVHLYAHYTSTSVCTGHILYTCIQHTTKSTLLQLGTFSMLGRSHRACRDWSKRTQCNSVTE